MLGRYFGHLYGYVGFVIFRPENDQARFANLPVCAGFGATQGVFREYYFRNPPFKGNQLVASIGLLVVVSFARFDPHRAREIGRTGLMCQGHPSRIIAFPPSFYRQESSCQTVHDVDRNGLGRGLDYWCCLFYHCESFVDLLNPQHC